MKATRNISTSSDDCASEILSPTKQLSHNKRHLHVTTTKLSELSVDELKDLVTSLKHVIGHVKAEKFQHILQEECIDGFCLSQLDHDELEDIGFDPAIKELFVQRLLTQTLNDDDDPPSQSQKSPHRPTSCNSAAACSFFGSCDAAPPPLISTTAAFAYGKLVVLGYREHRISGDQTVFPVGNINDVFHLVRQPMASGVRLMCENVYLRENGAETNVVNIPLIHSNMISNSNQNPHTSVNSPFRMVLEPSSQVIRAPNPGIFHDDVLRPYKVEAIFSPDPDYDMFQVGRYEGLFDVESCNLNTDHIPPRRVNDIVIKGLVAGSGLGNRGGTGSSSKGAISRVACRLMCERSTGRTYVLAGGFSASKSLQLPDKAPQWIRRLASSDAACAPKDCGQAGLYPSRRAPSRPIVSRSSSCPPPHRVAAHNVSNSNNRAKVRTKIGEYDYDAFTMQGIKLFSPCTGNWHEVSVMGRMYTLRGEGSNHGVLTAESNELVTGSILDIGGGVCLTFDDTDRSKTITSGRELSLAMDVDTTAIVEDDPNHFLDRLNGQNPVCPVLMNSLHFPPRLPARRQALARLQSLRETGRECGYVACQLPNQVSLPPLTHAVEGIEEDQRPYVFTACGHCFGYNPAFSGKACPLCRQMGPYVPLQFPFSRDICSEQPTHVFHPCGHAASLQTCKYWSQIPVPDSNRLHEHLFPHVFRRGGAERRLLTRRHSTAVDSYDADNRSDTPRNSHPISLPSLAVPLHPACPFCSTRLEVTAAGGNSRFSKLVVQFEDGNLSLGDI